MMWNFRITSSFEQRQVQSDTAMRNKIKIKHHRIPHNSKDLRHQRNPRALNPPERTGLRNLCNLCNLWDIRAQSKNSPKNLVVSKKTLIFAGKKEIQ